MLSQIINALRLKIVEDGRTPTRLFVTWGQWKTLCAEHDLVIDPSLSGKREYQGLPVSFTLLGYTPSVASVDSSRGPAK